MPPPDAPADWGGVHPQEIDPSNGQGDDDKIVGLWDEECKSQLVFILPKINPMAAPVDTNWIE